MVTIKHTKESIAELEKQLYQYKTAHHKLTAGLKEAVAESIQYKRERDELIEDVEKLREVVENREKIIEIIKNNRDVLMGESISMSDEIDILEEQLHVIKKNRDSLIKDVEKLREEKAAIEMYLDAVKTYYPMYEELNKKYNRLTEHIKLKAENNPSVSRYINLVLYIDELEADKNG